MHLKNSTHFKTIIFKAIFRDKYFYIVWTKNKHFELVFNTQK